MHCLSQRAHRYTELGEFLTVVQSQVSEGSADVLALVIFLLLEEEATCSFLMILHEIAGRCRVRRRLTFSLSSKKTIQLY